MDTVFFVGVDKTLTQRLTTPSVLQGMEPLHVTDAAHLLSLKDSGRVPEIVFIGPACPEPVRLVQSVYGFARDASVLICRIPEEYDEVRRALQFAPMQGREITCTTISDPVDVELQEAISRSRRRRQVQAAIHASNGFLASAPRTREVALRYVDRLLEALPIGVLLFDTQNRILDCNQHAAQMFGWSQEFISGKSLPALLPEEQWVALHQAVEQALLSTEEVIFPLACKSGSTRDCRCLEIRAVSVEPEGESPAVLCILQDMTERQHAETVLRQQWHTFDTALSNTPDFTYILDLEGRFTYVNRALLSLWKISLEDAVGKNFFDLKYPDQLAAQLEKQVQQVVDTKLPVRDLTPFTGPTGETRHYEYILVPVLSADGQVEAVAGSTRDVTERERMERALAASEEKLQRVFAQAPVAISALRGRDFIVELANPPYQALLQGRQLVGRRLADVVPELKREVWDTFNRVLDSGEPFVANEWHIRYDYDRDGVPEDHWFNVAYNPLRELDGAVSGLIAVLTDVTAPVLARRELERVNQELEEFAYVASHDLQEPLRMINAYTQLLLRRFVGENAQAQGYAEFIRQGVARMEMLIRDLLSYSHAVHRDDMPVGTAALSDSLAEAQTVLQSRIEESGAMITAQALPTVRGERTQLDHVFQNLLSNGLKYRRTGVRPEIHIGAELNEGYWTISVRDNGIGFEPRYADGIFGLFKRLHKEEYPGTGLGLAICKRIVERYGGRIWAEGRPGEGAIFRFTLPRAEEAE